MIGLIGSTGTLGRALKELLPILKFHSRRDFDLRRLRDAERYLRGFLRDLKFVINAAAYTDVDGAERNRVEATLVNADFPKVLARVSRDMGVRLVHVSTDYVFDGRVGFYYEDDHPQPLGVYGKSKLLGERYVLEENPDAIVIRTSWLFGPGGRNFFSRLPAMLLRGERIHAHDRQVSSPTYAPFLARVIFEMIEGDVPGGIYHITGRTPITPFQAAVLLADDLNSPSEIVRYDPGTSMGIRPRVSVLLSSRYRYTPPSFLTCMRDYVERLRTAPPV